VGKVDPKRRLADDARRLHGLALAVTMDAERQGAPLPEDVQTCLHDWRAWWEQLAAWAHEDPK
jgi:hypothetical protein